MACHYNAYIAVARQRACAQGSGSILEVVHVQDNGLLLAYEPGEPNGAYDVDVTLQCHCGYRQTGIGETVGDGIDVA